MNEKGVFQGFQAFYKGNSKAITTYGLLTSYTALQKPLPKKLWAKPGRYPLSLKLRFHIDPMRVQSSSVKVLGPIIEITRVSFAETQFNRRLAELIDKYMPPKMITPAGVAVDFVRLYKMINTWNDSDPYSMRTEDLRLFVEALKESVHRAPINSP